jgi:hypothetical protein
LVKDQRVMPIRATGLDRATSATCPNTSFVKRLGLPAPAIQGYQVMPSRPWALKRWMRARTHCGVQSQRVAMSRLHTPPRESRTMRAWRALTALAF